MELEDKVAERIQILDVKIRVLAHLPPDEFRAVPLQRQPRRHVRFVVHVGQYDFVANAERLPNRFADESNERRRVHPEGNFTWIARVQEISNTLPSSRDRSVDFLALCIPPASLHVAIQQVSIDCVQHILGNLRSGRVVEKYEGRLAMQGREKGTDAFDGESR